MASAAWAFAVAVMISAMFGALAYGGAQSANAQAVRYHAKAECAKHHSVAQCKELFE